MSDLLIPESDVDYPRDVFQKLISGNSPYAFYIFQWVPYQTDAKRWRLKMCHDVKGFDGRIEMGIWPNGNGCGSFKDDEVEFIRISKNQHGIEWTDPRGTDNA
jgi:phenolic acid decarboxylase